MRQRSWPSPRLEGRSSHRVTDPVIPGTLGPLKVSLRRFRTPGRVECEENDLADGLMTGLGEVMTSLCGPGG